MVMRQPTHAAAHIWNADHALPPVFSISFVNVFVRHSGPVKRMTLLQSIAVPSRNRQSQQSAPTVVGVDGAHDHRDTKSWE